MVDGFEKNNLKNNNMTTTEKILAGVAVAVAVLGIYLFFIRKGEEIAGKVEDTGGGGTGGGGAGGGGGSASTVPSQTLGGTALGLGIPNTIKPPRTALSSTTIRPKPAIVGGGRGGKALDGVVLAGVGKGADGSWSSDGGWI